MLFAGTLFFLHTPQSDVQVTVTVAESNPAAKMTQGHTMTFTLPYRSPVRGVEGGGGC